MMIELDFTQPIALISIMNARAAEDSIVAIASLQFLLFTGRSLMKKETTIFILRALTNRLLNSIENTTTKAHLEFVPDAKGLIH